MPTIDAARGWYPANDPVHGFDHVLRVLKIAEFLAEAEGANLEIVRAAALLHDAVGADPNGEAARSAHHEASANFANQVLTDEGWGEEQIRAVQHCIRAHRYRSTEAPETLEAKVLFDADKLDVLGAFGAARTIAYAVQAGQPIFGEVSDHFLQTGKTEAGEPHSSYHEYMYKLRHVYDRLQTTTAQKFGEKRRLFLDLFYQQLVDEASGKL
jgi:uncharacterized protein